MPFERPCEILLLLYAEVDGSIDRCLVDPIKVKNLWGVLPDQCRKIEDGARMNINDESQRLPERLSENAPERAARPEKRSGSEARMRYKCSTINTSTRQMPRHISASNTVWNFIYRTINGM